jgi:hypothetical protein
VPKGRIAEDGRIPVTYRLKKMPTDSYPARTEQNAIDSDGTVIISHGKLTGGSKQTQDLARKHGKPCLHIDIYEIPQFLAASEINKWVVENEIETLNVAGSRASKDPKIYNDTLYVIEAALLLSIMQADPRARIRDYSLEEYIEKVPALPRRVDEAADQLIRRMSLIDRNRIARMDMDRVMDVYDSLKTYIKKEFQLSTNEELMASCRMNPVFLIEDEDDAVAVIIAVLHKELQDQHRLKVVH